MLEVGVRVPDIGKQLHFLKLIIKNANPIIAHT